jgi:hypothetical protein
MVLNLCGDYVEVGTVVEMKNIFVVELTLLIDCRDRNVLA